MRLGDQPSINAQSLRSIRLPFSLNNSTDIYRAKIALLQVLRFLNTHEYHEDALDSNRTRTRQIDNKILQIKYKCNI